MNTFASPEDQVEYTYKSSAEDIAGDLDDALNSSSGAYSGSYSANGKIEVSISEDAMDLITQYAPVDGLEELNSIAIDYDVSMDGMNMAMNMGLLLGEEEITSLEYIIDYEEGVVALNWPDVNDEALFIDLGMDIDSEDFQATMELYEKILPKKGLIEKALPKYIEAAAGALGDVKKSEKKFEAGGVSQKAKAYTATIDGEVANDMIIALVKTLKNDKDMGAYIQQIIDVYSEMYYGEDMGISWNDVKSQLGSAIEELEDMGTVGDFEIDLTTWVDSDFNILAIELTDGSERIFVGKAKDGSDVGYEIIIEDDDMEYFSIVGSGQEKKGKFTGEFVLSIEETEYFYLDVEDFSSEDGYMNGRVVLSASEDFYKQIGYSELAYFDINITLDMKNTAKASELVIGLEMYDMELGTITVTGEIGKAKEITLPEDGTYDEEEWSENADPEVILEKLEEAIPEELYDSIMNAVEEESYAVDEDSYYYY